MTVELPLPDHAVSVIFPSETSAPAAIVAGVRQLVVPSGQVIFVDWLPSPSLVRIEDKVVFPEV